MALYRATVRVQDGENRYLIRRWIDAGSHDMAQEIAAKWVQVLNSDPDEYRGYELRAVEDKGTVIDQVRNVDQGMTDQSVENLLGIVEERV